MPGSQYDDRRQQPDQREHHQRDSVGTEGEPYAEGRDPRVGLDELEVTWNLLVTDLALTILAQLFLRKLFTLFWQHYS